MTSYTLSPKAQTDLDDIWNYTVKRWNEDQAEVYLRTIKEACQRLALAPHLGRSCGELRPRYFQDAVGSHVMFFRRREGGVEIVRILHHRMDFGRHL